MQSLLLPLDLYCERISAGFFSEPLNLFSNLLFIILAIFSWRTLGKQAPMLLKRSDLCMLHALFFLIGLGSFLFHGFANRAAQALDVLPIMIFMFFYLYRISVATFGSSFRDLLIIATGFALLNLFFAISFEASVTNGSHHYFASLFFLMFFWVRLRQRHVSAAKHMRSASLLFGLALFFRSIDLWICEAFPFGTHFLWHVLVALVVYQCLRALQALYMIKSSPSP